MHFSLKIDFLFLASFWSDSLLFFWNNAIEDEKNIQKIQSQKKLWMFFARKKLDKIIRSFVMYWLLDSG